jgi:hypothetical protein
MLPAQTMIEKQELAASFEHSIHFVQCLGDIPDAAQGERADGAIKTTVPEREPLAADNPLINLECCLLDPLHCQPVHSRIRLNRRELADFFGVEREVQASPEAYFQYIAMSRGQQFSSMLSQQGLVQEEIAKARGYYL